MTDLRFSLHGLHLVDLSSVVISLSGDEAGLVV